MVHLIIWSYSDEVNITAEMCMSSEDASQHANLKGSIRNRKIRFFFFFLNVLFFRIQKNSGTKSKTNETNNKMLILWKTGFVFSFLEVVWRVKLPAQTSIIQFYYIQCPDMHDTL